MVVNPSQCSAAGDPQSFDTSGSSPVSFIAYLKSLSIGTILVGVTCDDAYVSLAPAFPLLLSMGVDVIDVGSRGMFAFILQTGFQNRTIFSKTVTRADPLTMVVLKSGETNDIPTWEIILKYTLTFDRFIQ